MSATNVSYTGDAVARTNAYLKPVEGDYKVKNGGKVALRAVANTALIIFAAAEAFSALAKTFATFPLAYTRYEGTYQNQKAHAKDAAFAGVNAGKGIFGYAAQKKVVAMPTGRLEQFIALATRKEAKIAYAAVALGVSIAALYYFGPSALNGVTSYASTVKDTASDYKSRLAQYSLEKLCTDSETFSLPVFKDFVVTSTRISTFCNFIANRV